MKRTTQNKKEAAQITNYYSSRSQWFAPVLPMTDDTITSMFISGTWQKIKRKT